MKPAADETPPDALLAVIIPAFRRRYLAETLASFAAQTDRRFHLYVADDGSPEDLGGIVEPFRGRMNLTYRRFEDNLGVPGLVRHWHRAIALSHEPWLWLFSDDDLAAPDCVECIHRRLSAAPAATSLLRFDVEFIDAGSASLLREVPFPEQLSAVDYAYRLLTHDHEPCMIQNVVFPRSVFLAEGGFSPTAGGYCSDNASWPRFARLGGIRRLGAGKVFFRRHDTSVGAHVGFRAPRRHDAIEAYRETLRSLRIVAGAAECAQPRWRRAEMSWFAHWFRYLPRPLLADERALVARVAAELWPRHGFASRFCFWRNYARALLRHAVRKNRRLTALGRRVIAWFRARRRPGSGELSR